MSESPRASVPPDASVLASELEHTKRVLATKLTDLRTFQTERETLLARIAERDSRIQRLEGTGASELPRLKTRLQDLESELAALRAEVSKVSHLEAEAGALRAQARRHEASLAERDARVAELAAALGTERARLDELAAALAAERERLAERDARIRELESELSMSLEWGPAPADDLTRIKGIGPKFRDALAAAGVKTFGQIAGWTEADLAETAAKLRIQPQRLQGWVEAAKALAAQGQRSG